MICQLIWRLTFNASVNTHAQRMPASQVLQLLWLCGCSTASQYNLWRVQIDYSCITYSPEDEPVLRELERLYGIRIGAFPPRKLVSDLQACCWSA